MSEGTGVNIFVGGSERNGWMVPLEGLGAGEGLNSALLQFVEGEARAALECLSGCPVGSEGPLGIEMVGDPGAETVFSACRGRGIRVARGETIQDLSCFLPITIVLE